MKLVTGGAGYVGSHLAKRLLGMGEKVRIFDIVERTKYLPEDAEFMRGDMRKYDDCLRACDGVDTVFHLAFVQTFVLVKPTMDEKTMREINIGGTENFLKAAVAKGVDRLVHTSTIEIYGTNPPYPCYEDAPKHPTNIYAKHKWECEPIVLRYFKEFGLNVSILRMPTICGPGFYPHKSLLILMDRIIDGKWIPMAKIEKEIVGDFVHLEDVIDAYILASKKEEAIGEAFNVSARETATHYELVKAMMDEMGSKSKLRILPTPLLKAWVYLGSLFHFFQLPRDQYGYLFHNCRYAIDKAKKLLGYSPKYSVTNAARELIREYAKDREYLRERKPGEGMVD